MATSVKITTIGNSAGIVLPKEVLNHLHVAKGDIITLTESPTGFNMTAYDETFMLKMEAAERVMRKYKDALRKLAE